MKLLAWITMPLLSAAACMPSGRRYDYGEFARSHGVAEPARNEQQLAAAEATLATETRIDIVLRIALLRNADVLEDQERVRERLDRVPPAGRLPDLELKYEQWGVPLSRPYALNRADTLMLGVRQSFPAPGSLDARERIALADAAIALDTVASRRLDITRQIRLAFYDYALAQRELAIHLQHVELTQQILELTRSNFRVGTATEQDVLRVGVALQGLHRDIARIDQRTRSSAALLNSLMARSPSAALGPPAAVVATEIGPSLADLERLQHRPELQVAAHTIERATAQLDEARSTARWPTFMVGVDYWYMPESDVNHAYGAMASINLPWLNARHREEVRAGERAVLAERRAREAVAIAIRYEIADAHARYEAARSSYLLTRDQLLPVAQQSFESARASFAAGRGQALALLDSLRTLLDIRLEEVRELIVLETAITNLERAVGTDFDEAPLAAQGAKP